MVISKKLILTVLLILGLLLGLGAVWVWNEYKDDVKNIVSNDDDKQEEEDEFDTPYVASSMWDFTLSINEVGSAPWGFYIFQPKVLEYKTVNGVNYLIGEYTWGDSIEAAERHTVNIILTREEDWSLNNKELDKDSFEKAVTSKVTFQESFNASKIGFYGRTLLTFEELKEKFPVGDRIALAIPGYYPTSDQRTTEVCVAEDKVCNYAEIWDVLSSELVNFNDGEPVSEDFILVPYSVSSDLYKWSDEGVEENSN